MQKQHVNEGAGNKAVKVLEIDIAGINFDPYLPLGKGSFVALHKGLKVVVAAVSDAERTLHEGTMIKIMVPGNFEPVETRLSQVDPNEFGKTALELVQAETGHLFGKGLFAGSTSNNERG